MIEILKAMEKPPKNIIHINNTNPIIDEDSPQRKHLNASGIEVSYDNMEIEL
jgi:pyrroloquinoline quinone biosynthesis protein B